MLNTIWNLAKDSPFFFVILIKYCIEKLTTSSVRLNSHISLSYWSYVKRSKLNASKIETRK